MALLGAFQVAARQPNFYLRLFSVSKPWFSTKASLMGDQNILLMGSPGAGKTTVGRIVAHRLGLCAVDIDDDVLEKTWRMPVATKLASLGGQRFLEEEGQVLCNFSASACVVSLTGSNPLHSAAMQHVRASGVVVYLDVDDEDIIQRLATMEVNRIVGQETGVSMKDILKYRKQFYEKWLDVRVLCGRGDTAMEVAEKVLQALQRYQSHSCESYVSTRGDDKEPANFSDVVVEGLAKDGGLYVPQNGLPVLSPREWVRLRDMSYRERALVLLEKCIHPFDVSPLDLREMVCKAYGPNFSSEAVAPVKPFSQNQYILELFHGPTASFKDFAMQFMPQLFAHCLPPMCNYLVLVATSGDTGSAVLSGFSRLSGADRHRIGVLVFFPEDGVSDIQKVQMTSFREGSSRAVSILSDFDFCQRSIKRMFGETSLTGHFAVEYGTVLSTANSINWARLLPQVTFSLGSFFYREPESGCICVHALQCFNKCLFPVAGYLPFLCLSGSVQGWNY